MELFIKILFHIFILDYHYYQFGCFIKGCSIWNKNLFILKKILYKWIFSGAFYPNSSRSLAALALFFLYNFILFPPFTPITSSTPIFGWLNIPLFIILQLTTPKSAAFSLTPLSPLEKVCRKNNFLQISIVEKKNRKLHFFGQTNIINFAKTLVPKKKKPVEHIHTKSLHSDTKPT